MNRIFTRAVLAAAGFLFFFNPLLFSNTAPHFFNPDDLLTVRNSDTGNSPHFFAQNNDNQNETALNQLKADTCDPVEIIVTHGSGNAVNSNTICNGETATLTASVLNAGYLWSTDSMVQSIYVTQPGPYTVTVTYPDGCTQSATVNIQVTGIPPLICLPNPEVSINPTCTRTVVPADLLDGTYYCDYIVSITSLNGQIQYGNTLSAANAGASLLAKVKYNMTGDSCMTTLTVADLPPLSISCTDFSVSCAEVNFEPEFLASAYDLPAMPDLEWTCTLDSLYHSDVVETLNCDPNHVALIIHRTWVATDGSGNSFYCQQNISVLSPQISTVALPEDTVLDCAADANTITAAIGAPFIVFPYPNGPAQLPLWPSGNICLLEVTAEDEVTPINCAATNSQERTWKIKNLCEPETPGVNPAEFVQQITFIDQTAPAFTCPPNTTVNITSSQDCCKDINLPDLVVADNCSGISSFTAQVFWLDDTPLQLPFDTTDIAVNLTNFPGNDLQNPDTLAVLGNTGCLPVGLFRVRYSVSDDCGNQYSCSYTMTFREYMLPITDCKPVVHLSLNSLGKATIGASFLDDGTTSYCGSPLYFKVKKSVPNSSTCNGGVSEINDFITYCCDEMQDPAQAILYAYTYDPGPGAVNPDSGVYNICITQVTLVDTLQPHCTAPPDTMVTCLDFKPSLPYGSAATADNCCLQNVEYQSITTGYDTLCQSGTVVRKWTATDCFGRTGTCTQQVIVNHEQYYFLKFPDDKLVSVCDNSPSQFGVPTFYGEGCEQLVATFQDEIFTVVPDACFKIERTWTVLNSCNFDSTANCIVIPNPNPVITTNAPANLKGVTISPPGTTLAGWEPTVVKITPSDPAPTNYSIFWDVNANCYKYKQIIKIYDTQDPVAEPPATNIFCDSIANNQDYWNGAGWQNPVTGSNDLDELETPVVINANDACSGNNITFRFLLFLDIDDNGTQESVVNSVNPPSAGNVLYNNYQSPNYIGGQLRQFDFRQVQANELWRFMVKKELLPNGMSQGRVIWKNSLGQEKVPELPQGKHKIKWFVEDGCGNEGIFDHNFTISDCAPPVIPVTIKGSLRTEQQEGVENAIIFINGVNTPTFFEPMSDNVGYFETTPLQQNETDFTITPFQDIDPLNGVNTWDLVLISRHILGLEPLNSPYKLIAADANQSNTITTFDIVELRKLILGTYTTLPNNYSWRFVDADQVFTAPDNPFADTIRESINWVKTVPPDTINDFIGLKIGDVDLSAIPNNLITTEERTNGIVLYDIEDRYVHAGETVNVKLSASEPVSAHQFTLNTNGLQPIGLVSGSNMTAENFGIFDRAITTAWEGPPGTDVPPAFVFEFKATQSGQLSDMLQLSGEITRAAAFSGTSGLRKDVALRFSSGTISGQVFELYQNVPNPWTNRTQIGFYLPESGDAVLTIFDAAGRALYSESRSFEKGYNAFFIGREDIEAAAGAIFYQVKTANGVAMKRMASQ